MSSTEGIALIIDSENANQGQKPMAKYTIKLIFSASGILCLKRIPKTNQYIDNVINGWIINQLKPVMFPKYLFFISLTKKYLNNLISVFIFGTLSITMLKHSYEH